MTVRIRDIAKTGSVLENGAKVAQEVSGPDFSVDDPSDALAEARKKAAADALRKANEYAKALGVTLGPIVDFRENDGGGQMRARMMESAMARSPGQGGAPPVNAGTFNVTAGIIVTWEIAGSSPAAKP